MKALRSCCSKAIIEKHKDVGFSCFFKDLSRNRAELCLFPAKDVRIRCLHLLSLRQHRRLQPFLSSSSPSPDSQAFPSKTVNVKFELQKECSFGEQFFIVGDHPLLGLWDPESALPLTWSEGHVWTAELGIPVGVSIQFKFLLKTRTGDLLWQPDPDRIFESLETENTIIVCEDWEKAENQKVVEEELIANEDGPLLDSEMAIAVENFKPPEEELIAEANPTSPGMEQLQALSEESATGDVDTLLEKPLPIVAENISYPEEDFIANADNGVLCSSKTNYPYDEALDVSNMNALIAEDLGENDRVETADAEGNLEEYEGNPVLVPGLSPVETMSAEESMVSEDDKNITTDASVGVNEALNQRSSEPEKKQEPEGTPQEKETTAAIKDYREQNINQHIQEPVKAKDHKKLNQHIQQPLVAEEEEQLNQHIQDPLVAEEEQPDPESFRSNVLQSDVQWGRNALQKLLNVLRFR
ncbi:Carbohydrate-binding-like fold, putative isoform 3 [Hibiscus syriacus]|uniref:Carbohydrate-binding-like fold, putative isoform 3 n=1 Tax=Hibiscus syriacus TaxID=106335 RepID=A0A6A2WNY1_HIBSY|nr:Carbohydrate-binding-like fold, putative isoform 3 [Hibiscus syriacus]